MLFIHALMKVHYTFKKKTKEPQKRYLAGFRDKSDTNTWSCLCLTGQSELVHMHTMSVQIILTMLTVLWL